MASGVQVKEIDGRLVVSGPYDSMRDVYPKLKSKGFRYDPDDRSWWIDVSALTPIKRKNIDKLLGNGGEAAATQRTVDFQTLVDKAVKLKLFSLSFSLNQSLLLVLSGNTSPLKDEIKRAGGTWDKPNWVFHPTKLHPEAFEKLLVAAEKRSHIDAVHMSLVTAFVKEAPRHWPNLGITMVLSVRNTDIDIGGNTRPFASDLKEIDSARWLSSHWSIPTVQVTLDQLKRLIAVFDTAEASKRLSSPHLTPRNRPEAAKPAGTRQKSNQKAQNCARCGVLVRPNEGWLDEMLDDNEDPIWTVTHKDTETCEANRAAAKIRHEKARTKQEAKRNLATLAQQTGTMPAGMRSLLGEHHWLNRQNVAYGSGEWVVIEPSGQYFWYVRNHGADADDWSQNNVETGGAGAKGWRAPLTDEAAVLIEVAAID